MNYEIDRIHAVCTCHSRHDGGSSSRGSEHPFAMRFLLRRARSAPRSPPVTRLGGTPVAVRSEQERRSTLPRSRRGTRRSTGVSSDLAPGSTTGATSRSGPSRYWCPRPRTCGSSEWCRTEVAHHRVPGGGGLGDQLSTQVAPGRSRLTATDSMDVNSLMLTTAPVSGRT
jgi:hypothetical protein